MLVDGNTLEVAEDDVTVVKSVLVLEGVVSTSSVELVAELVALELIVGVAVVEDDSLKELSVVDSCDVGTSVVLLVGDTAAVALVGTDAIWVGIMLVTCGGVPSGHE